MEKERKKCLSLPVINFSRLIDEVVEHFVFLWVQLFFFLFLVSATVAWVSAKVVKKASWKCIKSDRGLLSEQSLHSLLKTSEASEQSECVECLLTQERREKLKNLQQEHSWRERKRERAKEKWRERKRGEKKSSHHCPWKHFSPCLFEHGQSESSSLVLYSVFYFHSLVSIV